jgi:hypothetical protein
VTDHGRRYRLEDLPERIAAKIRINPETGCWEWQGWRSHDGYGYVWWEGKDRSVHRTVFELLARPVPEGFTLDHFRDRGCRSKACCWPTHLEPVTTAENTARFWAGRTHCSRNHALTPENLYVRPSTGGQECRKCRQAARQAWTDRRKAA